MFTTQRTRFCERAEKHVRPEATVNTVQRQIRHESIFLRLLFRGQIPYMKSFEQLYFCGIGKRQGKKPLQ